MATDVTGTLPVGKRITITGTVEREGLGDGTPGLYPRAFIRTDSDDLIWGTLFAPLSTWPGSMTGTRVRFRAVLEHTTSTGGQLPPLHYQRPTRVEVILPPPSLPPGTRMRKNVWAPGRGCDTLSGGIELDPATNHPHVRLDEGALVPLEPTWSRQDVTRCVTPASWIRAAHRQF